MNDYVVEKRLGQGAFGIAVLVRCKKDNVRYCIKEVNTAKMKPREREDARKEVAVIAQLDHPNIVRYCKSFEEGGYLKIVMEYCDGGDLYTKIGNQRGVLFSEEQVLDWFVQICLALKHMHDRKILHRDLKSQNIFMCSTGKLKLGDFGIAKVLNSTMELARTAIGTPYYLSPEICEGRPYNNKSDIWSLGCVLYEMATLKHAFEAGNLKNLAMKIIRGTYPPISPMYSYELRTLVNQIFKRNPRERPGINAVLRKSLLSRRIDKFLTEGERQSEFSHTVMHGKRIAKVLPKSGPSAAGARAPRPLPPNPLQAAVKRPSAGAPEPSKARRYDPAAVYGAGMKRARPSPSPSPRPVASPSPRASPRPLPARPSTPQQKRAEEQQKRAAEVAKQYKEMMEKQRKEHLNRAREQGWRSVLSSESNSSQETPKRTESPRGAGDYAGHHEALDRMRQERQDRQSQDRQPGDYMGADAPPSPRDVAQEAEVAQARGADAAQKARMVEEFLARKREAAVNRHRGLGAPYSPMGGAGARPKENNPQEDYLERLRQIRMQNFRERRNMHEKLVDGGGVAGALGGGGNADAIRREKIEKLKHQAEERASRLKEQLEQRRREAMQKEKDRLRCMREDMAANRAAPASPGPVLFPKKSEAAEPSPGPILFPKKSEAADPSPSPVLFPKKSGAPSDAAAPALQKGPSITAVMQQLQQPEPPDETRRKKENILKRLNAKKVQDRSRWDDAQDRSRWDEAPMGGVNLAQITLEATASQMQLSGDVQEAARRQWAGGDSVANLLAKAEILATTTQVPNVEGTEEPPEKSSGTNLTRKGTFVIARPPPTSDKPSNAKPASSAEPTEPQAKLADAEPVGTLPLEKPTLENVELPEAPKSPHKIAQFPLLSMVTEESVDVTMTTEKKPQEDPAPKKEEVSDADVDRLANAALRSSGENPGPQRMEQEGPLRGKWVSPPVAIKCEGEGSLFEKSTATKPEASAVEESMNVEDMEAETPRGEKKKEEEEKKEESPKPASEDAKSEDGGSSVDDEEMELLRQSYQDVLESVDDAERAMSDDEGKQKMRAKTTKDANELKLCLTLGKFDMASAAKLRTCSLPDLSKLFEDDDTEAPLVKSRKLALSEDLGEGSERQSEEEERKSMEVEDEERKSLEVEDEERKSLEVKEKKDSRGSEENEGEEQEEEEEEEEEEEDEEEEDEMLESVRQSMRNVLDLDSSSSVTEDTAGASNDNDVFEAIADDEDDDEETSCSGEWDDGDGDDDEDFGDEAEEGGGDIFLRLERMREELEEAIGGTLLLKAYNVVQALHEDEDEAVSNCPNALLPILGEEKMQFYDRIVQLVLADGIFMED